MIEKPSRMINAMSICWNLKIIFCMCTLLQSMGLFMMNAQSFFLILQMTTLGVFKYTSKNDIKTCCCFRIETKRNYYPE